MHEFDNPLTSRIAGFLREIGLDVRPAVIAEPTFLPGIAVKGGVLWVDETSLQHPGDLLHEAGHLALKSLDERKETHGNMGGDAGEEMGAIAWSYAALCHLQLDPQVVFHDDGYRSGSRALIQNFAEGRYIGVPILHWRGLSRDGGIEPGKGVPPYPRMLQWVRTE